MKGKECNQMRKICEKKNNSNYRINQTDFNEKKDQKQIKRYAIESFCCVCV